MENKDRYIAIGKLVVIAVVVLVGLSYLSLLSGGDGQTKKLSGDSLVDQVIPEDGVALPVVWGDMGKQLVSTGAIDGDRFQSMYSQRGQFSDEYRDLLLGENSGQLRITRENAGYLLNLLWAFGLANKNPILDSGEMVDPRYGGAGNFASTGGWSIAVGDAMDHYSKHTLVVLTDDQQALVDKISRGVYRPCCGNSTHFPDCNHGMAMLGLLELMASQGASEEDMWAAALAVNAYWFPDTYLTIATYMQDKGVTWGKVDPVEVLGFDYSSAQGFSRIAAQVTPVDGQKVGGSCSV